MRRFSDKLLSPLMPSTLVAQGMLTNVRFHESDLIDFLMLNGRIISAVCNYGEIYSQLWHDITNAMQKRKKTRRGRRPRVKAPSKRVRQGNGRHFDTQITFEVLSREYATMDPQEYLGVIKPKSYYVKVFRNGNVSVPGGLCEDLSDVHDSIVEVVKILSDALDVNGYRDVLFDLYDMELGDNAKIVMEYLVNARTGGPDEHHELNEMAAIKINDLRAITRNYKTHLINEAQRINIVALNTHLLGAPLHLRPREVKLNAERYSGLVVKYSTPTPDDPSKKITIKIFSSGKIDIDGATTRESAYQYYDLLHRVFDEYSHVIYIPRTTNEDSTDDDTDHELYDARARAPHAEEPAVPRARPVFDGL